MSKKALEKAMKEKDDEYYTKYIDIENELKYYKDYFKDKVIYCPCDNKESNFVKYFENNKDKLKYKKLVNTCIEDGQDFREQDNSFADIIVTNPPFSLFIDFMKWASDKDCIILGPVTALSYTLLFPFFKNRIFKLGVNFHKNLHFDTPSNNNKQINCGWYTTFPVRKNKPLELKTKAKNEANGIVYEKYDNCNAINVDRVNNIPSDYDGLMGVPVTFLEKWNKNDYEIVKFRYGDDNKDLKVNGKEKFTIVIIRRIK